MINHEFESISSITSAFPDEQACLDHLEKLRWNGHVVSPFDSLSKVYKCRNNNYRCSKTGKYFNAKTGTLFYNSKIELQKWFIAIWIVTVENQRITSTALGVELKITQKTAWFMIERIKSYYEITAKKRVRAKKKESPVALNETSMPMREWLELLKK